MTSYTSAPTYRTTSGYLMDPEGVLRRPISTLTPPPMSIQQLPPPTSAAAGANININSMPTPVPAPPPALHPMMYTLSTGGIPSNSQYYYGWQGPVSVAVTATATAPVPPTSVTTLSSSQSPLQSSSSNTAQLKDNKAAIDDNGADAIDGAGNVECNKINVNSKLGCDSVKDVPNLDSIKLDKSVNNTTVSNKSMNEKSKKDSERTYCF